MESLSLGIHAIDVYPPRSLDREVIIGPLFEINI